MVDSTGSHHGVGFLTRKHSNSDFASNPPRLPCHPPSTPDHDCREFVAPEGSYTLMNQIFFRSMTPLYTVGTTVSMVSIKYKDSTPNLQRYEPHPGARSFRRMFSGTSPHSISESEDDTLVPSFSSSSPSS
ncbi:hypothetical protein BDF14DRAFT_1980927, partial [Spinellus fusiger]